MKSKYLTLFLLLIAYLICVTSVVRAQTDVFLKIYTKTFQRMEIDLYPFLRENDNATTKRAADTVTEVLSNDLWMSGFFKVNIRAGVPDFSTDHSGDPGALAVITGKVTQEDKLIKLQPHLMDRASGKTIVRETYADIPGTERYLVHKIANDIVYSLTGERGIANSKVAFISQNTQGVKEVYVMDYDGFGARRLTNDKSIDLSPAWSPDGEKISYTSYKDDNPNLLLIHPKTGDQMVLSDLPGLNAAPAWSPEGSRIALTLTKDGNAEVYILDIARKKLRRLTFSNAIDSSPSWSPSGREIAFSSDRSGSPQIYIMDSDGVGLRRLTFEGSYNESPAWSPRGDKIAYVSRINGDLHIFSIDVTGENLMRLTYEGDNEDPCWSPNGFALVFSSTRSGLKDVYTMFWDGSHQKRVPGVGISYLPAWSPRLRY